MDVIVGIRRGIRRDTEQIEPLGVLVRTEIQILTAKAAAVLPRTQSLISGESLWTLPSAFQHPSILHNHGTCGPDSDSLCSLRQRGFPQENAASCPQRSLISFCGEFDHDPVFICSLLFSYELWEEDPRVEKQTQRELARAG